MLPLPIIKMLLVLATQTGKNMSCTWGGGIWGVNHISSFYTHIEMSCISVKLH